MPVAVPNPPPWVRGGLHSKGKWGPGYACCRPPDTPPLSLGQRGAATAVREEVREDKGGAGLAAVKEHTCERGV